MILCHATDNIYVILPTAQLLRSLLSVSYVLSRGSSRRWHKMMWRLFGFISETFQLIFQMLLPFLWHNNKRNKEAVKVSLQAHRLMMEYEKLTTSHRMNEWVNE